MLLSKVKQAIEFRTKSKLKLPVDDILQDIVQEASIYVANRCDPSELIRYTIDSETILKLIEGGRYIVEPEYPDFSKSDRHLQIDELLSYSVINYACFLLTKESAFKSLCDDDIGLYRSEYSRVGNGE